MPAFLGLYTDDMTLRWMSLASALLLAGCAGQAPVGAQAPADFGLSLSVMRAPAGETAAWYVVQPDGMLRAVVGERRENTPVPPVVRQLTPLEMERLWTIVYGAELLTGDCPAGMERAGELVPAGSDAAAGLAVTGCDHRRSFVATELTGVVGELDAALRELAWLNEER